VIPVRVTVRSRPMVDKEINEGCQSTIMFVPNEPQLVIGSDKAFTFDFVYSPDATQQQVYDESIVPLVNGLFRGKLLRNVASASASRLRNSLRSVSSSDYTLLRLRTKFGERAFSHAGPAAWNALPENIRANQDRKVFRKHLTTYLFSLAFNVH